MHVGALQAIRSRILQRLGRLDEAEMAAAATAPPADAVHIGMLDALALAVQAGILARRGERAEATVAVDRVLTRLTGAKGDLDVYLYLSPGVAAAEALRRPGTAGGGPRPRGRCDRGGQCGRRARMGRSPTPGRAGRGRHRAAGVSSAPRPLPDGIVTFLFSDVEGSTRLLERDPAALGNALARHHELLAGLVADHGVPSSRRSATPCSRPSAHRGTPWRPRPPSRARWPTRIGAPSKPSASGWPSRWGPSSGEATTTSGLLSFDVPASRRWPGAARRSAPATWPRPWASRCPPPPTSGPAGRTASRTSPSRSRSSSSMSPGCPSTTVPCAAHRPRRRTCLRSTPRSSADAARSRTSRRPSGATVSSRSSVRVAPARPGSPSRRRAPSWATSPTACSSRSSPRWSTRRPCRTRSQAAAGVAVRPGEAADAALARALADRHVLLVVDNWEHVLSAAPVVPQIVSGAPGVHVLATSRVPLRVRGERRMPVPQLDPAGDASVAVPAARRGSRAPDRPGRRGDGDGDLPAPRRAAARDRAGRRASGRDPPAVHPRRPRARRPRRLRRCRPPGSPADGGAVGGLVGRPPAGGPAHALRPPRRLRRLLHAVRRRRRRTVPEIASRRGRRPARGTRLRAGVGIDCRRSISTPSMAWPPSPRRASWCPARIRSASRGSGCWRRSGRMRPPSIDGSPEAEAVRRRHADWVRTSVAAGRSTARGHRRRRLDGPVRRPPRGRRGGPRACDRATATATLPAGSSASCGRTGMPVACGPTSMLAPCASIGLPGVAPATLAKALNTMGVIEGNFVRHIGDPVVRARDRALPLRRPPPGARGVAEQPGRQPRPPRPPLHRAPRGGPRPEARPRGKVATSSSTA